MEEADKQFYKNAKRQWNFAVNGSSAALKAWAAVAIISLSTLLVTLVFFEMNATAPKYIPYMVMFDPSSGKLDYKGFVARGSIDISDQMYRSYLIRFISQLRQISSDNVVNVNNLKDTYFIATPNAQKQLSEEIIKNTPMEKSNKGIRVDIRYVVFDKMGESTWRVQWIEDIRTNGVLSGSQEYSGTFSFVRGSVSDELTAERNPLGLYVSEFFISGLRVNN